MKNIINWKLFFILFIMCVISLILVIPYSSMVTSSEIEISAVFLFNQVVNALMFAVAAFFGLFFSKRIGMGLPILQNALEGKKQSKELKSIMVPSICWGILVGILIVLLSIPFDMLIPEFDVQAESISAWTQVWTGFLASFYGGIAEEVLLRLFLVSLLVWIIFKIKKTKDGHPTNLGIWLSIIIAAVMFGLGHLPAAAQMTSLTEIIVMRTIVLNGIGGIIFGWLYWKKGLESAMIAHFSADIILHVITPAIASFFL